ncbi:hypothetical protein KEM48_003511 [Puccinia striiformis f. sp. tritici PST-130]|nr:hypothetical protein Pst134EB_014375 [Puccinia striiformis f. sp. tritici]KAI9607602.1 hypothetical protein KEM48_003511 [Puccinia striiformis f. sp. tritici PST-130]
MNLLPCGNHKDLKAMHDDHGLQFHVRNRGARGIIIGPTSWTWKLLQPDDRDPGPWDCDWVDPNVVQSTAWLKSLGLDDDSNEVPQQEDSSMSDGEHSDSTAGSSHRSSFDEFKLNQKVMTETTTMMTTD